MTDRALQTVHLRDEAAALEATFLPGAGMLCSSLRHHGEELLAQNAGVGAYVQSGKTMGIPLLYPWANRLAAFDYTVGGRTVQMPHDESLVHTDANGLPIHGAIGGRQVWQLAGARELGSSSLAATLSWSDKQPQLFELFPFRHDLRYEALLQGGRLEISVTVHACGTDAVPLVFGFHPYLSPGGQRGSWQIELPAMRALTLDAQQIPIAPALEPPAQAPLAQTLPTQRFELDGREFDDGFDSLDTQAHFNVTGADRRIEVTFLQGYPYAQVFAPASGQFVCFEPMTAPANALRSGQGLRLLAPGESFVAKFVVAVSEVR
ncbi:MAG TPA: aldose 1-epimerase [Solirubrobacteraceae bacterium]|jgi:aldose 1-epimerase|nr:aldose 1-epimerase [Solirubrobacteraceae bacterium]